MGTVNTKAIKDRRPLRFGSVDEALADIERCVRAEKAGMLTTTGNWSLGRVLGHLAFWANAPYDGYPPMRTPPFFIRWMIPLMKNGFIRKKMPAGFRIPGPTEGTFGTDELSVEEGRARVNTAFERLAKEAPRVASPVFGEMTHDEAIGLNLRHAELHLSFMKPRA